MDMSPYINEIWYTTADLKHDSQVIKYDFLKFNLAEGGRI